MQNNRLADVYHSFLQSHEYEYQERNLQNEQ